MKRVLGYVRVSTNHQDLQRQKDSIKEYCENNNCELLKIEEDFAVSGAIPKRDGLERVLKVDNSIYDMVVVCELSRISRNDNILETLQQIKDIISKVDLVMLDNPYKIYKAGDFNDITNFITLTLKAYGASEERRNIAIRMNDGIDKLLPSNVMMGVGSVPFGFKRIDNPNGTRPKNIFVVDDSTIGIVKTIYQYVLDGLSMHQIADTINLQYNTNLGFTTIKYILHNPFYNGKRVYKGKEYQMPVKIISDDMWNLVQERIQTNKTYNHEAQKHLNPLKGIAKCPCGANMTFICGKNLILTCANKAIRKKCDHSGMRAKYYIGIVWEDVKNNGLGDEFANKSNEAIKSLRVKKEKLESASQQKDKDIAEMEDKIRIAAKNLATTNNEIAINAINETINELQLEIDKTKKAKRDIKKRITKLEDTIRDQQSILTMTELENISMEGKAEIFRKVLKRTCYYSYGQHKGILEIEYKIGYKTCYLFKSNNYGGNFWQIPGSFIVDRENQAITNPIHFPKSDKGKMLIVPTSREYTFDEFAKLWDSIHFDSKVSAEKY